MGSFPRWFNRDEIKGIFRTHWESFKEIISRYREDRYNEVVQKMLGCGDAKNGYATYVCGECGGEWRRVPFSCKSCFCLSCAKVNTDRWAGCRGTVCRGTGHLIRNYGPRPSPAGGAAGPPPATAELSRFPCMVPTHRLQVSGSGKLKPALALSPRLHIAFPTAVQGRRSRRVISKINTAPVRPSASASPRHHWSSTHSLRPERIATPYSVKDFHLLHHAGFDQRFHNVPSSTIIGSCTFLSGCGGQNEVFMGKDGRFGKYGELKRLERLKQKKKSTLKFSKTLER